MKKDKFRPISRGTDAGLGFAARFERAAERDVALQIAALREQAGLSQAARRLRSRQQIGRLESCPVTKRSLACQPAAWPRVLHARVRSRFEPEKKKHQQTRGEIGCAVSRQTTGDRQECATSSINGTSFTRASTGKRVPMASVPRRAACSSGQDVRHGQIAHDLGRAHPAGQRHVLGVGRCRRQQQELREQRLNDLRGSHRIALA